ncbi:MAG: outer membrane beta-barrel protein [Oleiphilaceae bacterium]|jgi:outer membrane beta-barrel protein
MENWTQRILLKKCVALLLLSSVCSLVNAQEKLLVEPDVKPQIVDESVIDTENFEVGMFVGVINIEDFESSALMGIRVAYHVSDSLFFEANIGMAEGGDTSAEKLGGFDLLSDRDYTYYNFGLGFNAPGQTFFLGDYTFNNNIYFVGGVGSTEFGGDSELTVNFGAGYQLLVNDWMSLHVTGRQHLMRTDLTGEDKLVFNTELSTGLSFFF